jgi:prophage regulatory protein
MKNSFGHPKPAAPAGRKMLGPRQLPGKGIHYSDSYLRKLWQSGQFPAPIKLSPRKNAWWEEDIDAWLREKTEEAAA